MVFGSFVHPDYKKVGMWVVGRQRMGELSGHSAKDGV